MFLGRVTGWTSVVGQYIPFQTVKNTNSKITNSNGLLSLRTGGLWDIDAALTLSGVAGNVVVSVLEDGVATGATVTATTTAAGFVTVPIVDAIRTVLAQYPNVANVGLQIDTAGVTVSGTLRVENVR
jgi:hypothetical protein